MGKLNVVVLFDRWDEPEVESTSTEKAPLTRTLDKNTKRALKSVRAAADLAQSASGKRKKK